jgi:hypothetical protein
MNYGLYFDCVAFRSKPTFGIYGNKMEFLGNFGELGKNAVSCFVFY